MQTSLTPQFFPPAFAANFGWAQGVQWIYLTAMLWYESVYAIIPPIHLTEMLFPRRRNESWLSDRGLAVTAGVFVVASIGVWQLWNRVGLHCYGPSTYQVPVFYVVAALVVIAGTVVGTLRFGQRAYPTEKGPWCAPRPWLVWPISSGFSLAWFFLIILAYLPAATLHGASPLIPIAVGWVWVGLGLLAGTVRVWSSRADGRVPHSAGAAPDHRSGRRPGRSGLAAAIRPGGTKPARYRPRWPR